MLVAQRVADSNKKLADLQLLGITQFCNCIAVGIDFQDGNIRIRILTRDRSPKFGAIEQRDPDQSGFRNYMCIGEDQSVTRKNKARP